MRLEILLEIGKTLLMTTLSRIRIVLKSELTSEKLKELDEPGYLLPLAGFHPGQASLTWKRVSQQNQILIKYS